MLAVGVGSAWIQDLPLCFPGRDCFDVPPGGAQAMYLVSDLTPASPGIATVLWVGLVASLVLIGRGLWRHWRGVGLRPSPVLVAVGLVACGAVLVSVVNAWLHEAAEVYGGADGRPAEPTPSSVIGAWPFVHSAAEAGIALGLVALLLMLGTAAVQRRRAARAQADSLT